MLITKDCKIYCKEDLMTEEQNKYDRIRRNRKLPSTRRTNQIGTGLEQICSGKQQGQITKIARIDLGYDAKSNRTQKVWNFLIY